jgi:hypothetical protein
MIIPRQPKWIDLIYRCGGVISLKVGEDMDIGGVIGSGHSRHGWHRFRLIWPWEVMLFRIRPMLFL